VPYDPRKPFDPSGIRLGTPSVTSRGLTEEHMSQIAEWMDQVISAEAHGDASVAPRVRQEIREFLAPYPVPGRAD
jgi:glycine hydroxymethyltransferase